MPPSKFCQSLVLYTSIKISLTLAACLHPFGSPDRYFLLIKINLLAFVTTRNKKLHRLRCPHLMPLKPCALYNYYYRLTDTICLHPLGSPDRVVWLKKINGDLALGLKNSRPRAIMNAAVLGHRGHEPRFFSVS
jgi:hypothetical protein